VIGSHHNWFECSDTRESIGVWGETVRGLEKALRDAGYGSKVDALLQEVDEENGRDARS